MSTVSLSANILLLGLREVPITFIAPRFRPIQLSLARMRGGELVTSRLWIWVVDISGTGHLERAG